MGKFINILVPDFIYKSDDEYSGMGKMLLAGASLILYVSAFIKILCYLHEGQTETQWYLFIYNMMIAAACALAFYYVGLSILSMFVKLIIHFVWCLLNCYYRRRSICESQDCSSQVQKTGSTVNSPSFRDRLKCEDREGLIGLMRKSQEAGPDTMFLLATILVLIQNDVLSFGNMKTKEIHAILVAEFGDFVGYSYFNTLWNRIKSHDFKPSQLEGYDVSGTELFTEEDKDFDKYYRAHKSLKENGYI